MFTISEVKSQMYYFQTLEIFHQEFLLISVCAIRVEGVDALRQNCIDSYGI